MIYVTLESGHTLCGHLGNPELASYFKALSPSEVQEVQADGDELVHACRILSREVSPGFVHRFFGSAAKEIAMNWG